MADLFLDTSFAIALAAPTDRHHARARELASQLGNDKTRLVTTTAVLLEIGNARARSTALGWPRPFASLAVSAAELDT